MAARSLPSHGALLASLLALGGCFSDTPPTASASDGSTGEGSASGSGSTSGGDGSSTGGSASATTGESGSGDASSSSGTSTGGVESTGEGTSTTTTTGVDPTTGTGGDATTDTCGDTTTGGELLPIPNCQPLFYADFSSDPSATMSTSGEWTWDAQLGLLTADTTQTQQAAAWPKVLGSADYTVHTRLRIESGTGNGTLRARFMPLANPASWSYYFLALRSTLPESVRWGKIIQNQVSVFGSDQTEIPPGEWHILSLTVNGDKLDFALDGVILGGHTDGSLPDGVPAIGSYIGAVVSFDWFLVCAV